MVLDTFSGKSGFLKNMTGPERTVPESVTGIAMLFWKPGFFEAFPIPSHLRTTERSRGTPPRAADAQSASFQAMETRRPSDGKVSSPARRAGAACRLDSEKILVSQAAPPHPGPLPQRRGRLPRPPRGFAPVSGNRPRPSRCL